MGPSITLNPKANSPSITSKLNANIQSRPGQKLLTCTRHRGQMHFQGAEAFAVRIAMSTLSMTPITISEIRSLEQSPGITDYEESLLRLIEKVTNGANIKINTTGTIVRYQPGFIVGGVDLEHHCHPSRSIGYYMQALLSLAPFAKNPLSITLYGVCNDDHDRSVDVLRTVTLPLLQKFGVTDGVELKVKKRGAAPLGGGEVIFRCGNIVQLQPVVMTDAGMIKRVRGVAYTTRVAPTLSNRVVDAARSVLNHFIPDVWIYTDHYKGGEAGLSPGYALSLVAESTTGQLLAAEKTGQGRQMPPEELGDTVAKLLLEEIASGACVDAHDQSLIMLYMTLCSDDVSRVRFGKLSPTGIQYLRHLRDFFGVVFRFRPDATTRTVIASCRGVAFKNVARRALA